MTRPIRQRPTLHVIAAVTFAVPSLVFASSPPATAAKSVEPVSRLAPMASPQHPRLAATRASLLRTVVESLNEHKKQEASPFNPPGRPPGRPPDNPGHNNPPNPPGKPPDRPPGISGR